MDSVKCEAMQIVETNNDNIIKLNEKALAEMLMHPEIKNRFVVVVSVAGALRKGKSFLLNFFIRYCKSTYTSGSTKQYVLGNDNEPLEGFSWTHSYNRNTTGILLWSEIFFHECSDGKKVAIFLMDTQGIYDRFSTVSACTAIFALSTMVSSIQIFNLSQSIQESDLQYLQLFLEYGKLSLREFKNKPFQRLLFLVRDWSHPYEASYGAGGGLKYFKEYFKITKNQNEENQSIRRDIKSYFEDISCFLLPHPGQKVATNRDFDGRLADIEKDFKIHLEKLIHRILAPENLVLKKINGREVKASELYAHFVAYATTFQTGKLPEPKTILSATRDAKNSNALIESMELYEQLMKGVSDKISSMEELETQHLEMKQKAVDNFMVKKMGENIEKYLNYLAAGCDERFQSIKNSKELDSAKNNMDLTLRSNNILQNAEDNLPEISARIIKSAFDILIDASRTNIKSIFWGSLLGVSTIAGVVFYKNYKKEEKEKNVACSSVA